MIDLDAQCSLSISAGIEADNEKNSDYEKQIKDHREVLDVMREKYNVIGTLRKSAEANKGIYSGSPLVFYN